MEFVKPKRCAWIIQPDEFMIDRWDNQRCEERKPHRLYLCEECGEYFCLLFHWGKHHH